MCSNRLFYINFRDQVVQNNIRKTRNILFVKVNGLNDTIIVKTILPKIKKHKM